METTAQTILVHLPEERPPLAAAGLRIARRVLAEKGGPELAECRDAAAADLVLRLDAALPAEGYAISSLPAGLAVAGGAGRGLLYGIGRWLRDLVPPAAPGQPWRPGSWRGWAAPACPARGIYFATHFWNYYDEAPLPEIGRYLEDLALWGCNGLKVWFDMHHFNGIDDPRAQARIARLRQILRQASELGMDLWLAGLSNEGYDNSPENLRADWTSGHNGYTADPVGHYHRELCPNLPGGLELLMRWRGEVFDAFADLGIKYVSMSSYDQGGCTCQACAPWGTNGLLKVGRAYAELARSKLPGCKVIMSTWRFDRFVAGEWDGLHRAFKQQRPDWLDLLSVDFADLGQVIPWAPGGLPFFCMPEISMHGMLPWGGYGANPMPERIRGFWARAAGHAAGSFPYSEGIYEDLNKVVALQLQWEPGRPAAELVANYAAFYFGQAAAPAVVEAAGILENNLGHCACIIQDGKSFSTYRGPLLSFRPDRPWALEHRLEKPLRQAHECLEILEAANRRLPPAVAESWRWRLLFLRARLDAELAKGPADTETVRACCDELSRLYHAERCEKPCVVPPTAERYRQIFAKPIELWL